MRVNDGTTQFVGADRLARTEAAFDREMEYAEKAEEHLWVVLVAHRLSPEKARAMAAGSAEPTLLDAESVSFTGAGCYRCERALEARLIGKRCRGTS